jgi:penicillin-binding protein A
MRRWILIAAGAGLVVGVTCIFGRRGGGKGVPDELSRSAPSLVNIASEGRDGETEDSSAPIIAGLDLASIAPEDSGATAPAPSESGAPRTARLTVDPALQRMAIALMAANRLPEAAVVMLDVATSTVLVYASHIDGGPQRDLCVEATAPSASVFKIVTGAALLEDAHLTPETRQCYSGGAERILPRDLVEDPQRDRWCSTLAGAMGRSLNAVFARLAQRDLKPGELETMARRFGYGQSLPFDVPVQPSVLNIPGADPLEFARTAAGFWNTTLSPLQAAWLSAIVARGGDGFRPGIVRDVVDSSGNVVYTAPPPALLRHVVARETAQSLATMMEHTVSEGTSYRAFHDAKGTAFLPGVAVAGKTGTLTDPTTNRYYTWFTGFAPSRPPVQAGANGTPKQVAIAVLVVNQPTWQVKANVVARDMLRAYFAQDNVPGITRPSPTAIARHRH